MDQKFLRRRHIALLMLAVLLLLLIAGIIWQRNNITALKAFSDYSQEELEEQLQQNDQNIKDVVEAIPEVVVRDVTEEEKQALRDGTLSQEELAERLMGGETTPTVGTDLDPSTGDQKAPQVQPSQTPQPLQQKPAANESVEQKPQGSTSTESVQQKPEKDPTDSDYQNSLSALVAKVYVLREEYLIALDNLQAEATADYKAMAKEERTGSKLASFVSNYLAKGTNLEKECDRKMDAIVKELKVLIQENNGDLSLLDTVITTYANEKSLKKAWYMAELEKKGLI